MSPGIGLMKRRLEKEKDAIALAISGIIKNTKFLKTKSKHLKQSTIKMQVIGMLPWDGMKKRQS